MSEASRPAGRVLVVGAINVDVVVAAPHLPAPGETVVGAGVTRGGGGKGANSAVAAARAGAQVTFVGALGIDAAADEAERELLDDGVDCSHLQRLDDEPTGMALIVVDPDGENQIAVGAGANHALAADHVAGAVERLASAGLDCVLVSTEIPDAAVTAAVRAATGAGVTCVLNPAPPTPAVVQLVGHGPILTPNRGELAALLRALGTDAGADADGGDGVEAQAQALRRLSGAPVCVTLGAEGTLLCDGDGDGDGDGDERVPAVEVDVRDATGAGDTFNGVLAAWLAGGAPLREAVRAATVAGSLSVGEAGARAGMPRRDAILRALG